MTAVAPAAAYLGTTGLGFLLALSGFLLGAWLRAWLPGAPALDRKALGRHLQLAGAVGVLALLMVPVVRPFEVTETGEAVVAAIQGDVPGPGNDILFDHRQVTRNLTEATRGLARDVEAGRQPRPDFVVWPENGTAVDPFADSEADQQIRSAVAAIDVPVLVAAIVDDGPGHVLNQGIVWDPQTGPGERYTKLHPVAYGEYIPYRNLWNPQFGRLSEISRDMKAGTSTEPLTIAGVSVADAICFDVAYDEVLRDQVVAGAEMLTVQTSNTMFIFTDQIEQQFAMTRLRAIETGRWLVVASPNGRSGVIAPDGTVVAAAPLRSTEVMVERVGLSTTLTPAVRMGGWPAGVLGGLSVAVVLLGAALYRRAVRRERAAAAPASPDLEPETTSAVEPEEAGSPRA
jgi:apolipoprotein N-acyltransferase